MFDAEAPHRRWAQLGSRSARLLIQTVVGPVYQHESKPFQARLPGDWASDRIEHGVLRLRCVINGSNIGPPCVVKQIRSRPRVPSVPLKVSRYFHGTRTDSDRQAAYSYRETAPRCPRPLLRRDVKTGDRPRPRGQQKTGIGLGLGLDGNGLGLETLRPRPRVVWPRGLVYCNVLISCSAATATVKSVVVKTKDGNVVNEFRSGQEPRKKIGKPYPAIPVLPHGISNGLSSSCAFIVNPLWPRPRSRMTYRLTSGLVNIPAPSCCRSAPLTDSVVRI